MTSLWQKGGSVWSMTGWGVLGLCKYSSTRICVRTAERRGSNSTLPHSLWWVKAIPLLQQSDLFVSRRLGKKAARDIRGLGVSIRSRRKRGDLVSVPITRGRITEGCGVVSWNCGVMDEWKRRRKDLKAGMALTRAHHCSRKRRHSSIHTFRSLDEFGADGRQGMAFWNSAGEDWVKEMFLKTIYREIYR